MKVRFAHTSRYMIMRKVTSDQLHHVSLRGEVGERRDRERTKDNYFVQESRVLHRVIMFDKIQQLLYEYPTRHSVRRDKQID